MMRVLVTGGAGVLGRVLVSKLSSDSTFTVRVMSRHQKPDSLPSNIEWAQADLETGVGLSEAVADVQTIVHAASNPLRHTLPPSRTWFIFRLSA